MNPESYQYWKEQFEEQLKFDAEMAELEAHMDNFVRTLLSQQPKPRTYLRRTASRRRGK